jgi:hypothetical protein
VSTPLKLLQLSDMRNPLQRVARTETHDQSRFHELTQQGTTLRTGRGCRTSWHHSHLRLRRQCSREGQPNHPPDCGTFGWRFRVGVGMADSEHHDAWWRPGLHVSRRQEARSVTPRTRRRVALAHGHTPSILLHCRQGAPMHPELLRALAKATHEDLLNQGRTRGQPRVGLDHHSSLFARSRKRVGSLLIWAGGRLIGDQRRLWSWHKWPSGSSSPVPRSEAATLLPPGRSNHCRDACFHPSTHQ